MHLRHQNVVLQSIPASCPAFVRPADAERKIDRRVTDVVIEGPLEQAAAVEPVVVKTESVNAVVARQFNLAPLHATETQVIETKFARQARLVMTVELRDGLRDVAPFGEALSPPRIVLRDRMELGKIKGNQSHLRVANRDPFGRLRDKFGIGLVVRDGEGLSICRHDRAPRCFITAVLRGHDPRQRRRWRRKARWHRNARGGVLHRHRWTEPQAHS